MAARIYTATVGPEPIVCDGCGKAMPPQAPCLGAVLADERAVVCCSRACVDTAEKRVVA
jgi:hypothetical protein